jgi:hypothetical protein
MQQEGNMRHLYGSAIAVILAATVGSAQGPSQNPPASAGAAQGQGLVTVEGCLWFEADVPGRRPNVAERGAGAVGVDRFQDYILADTKIIKGSAPASATAAGQVDRPTGTAGAAGLPIETMYEIEGLDEDVLKQHTGRRVQIDGVFEKLGSDRVTLEDLLDVEATAIRPVSGECRKPSAR